MNLGRHFGFVCTLIITSALFLPLLFNQGPPVGLDLPSWTGAGYLLSREIVPDQNWFIGVILPSVNAGQQVGGAYSLNLMILWLFNQVFSPGMAAKLPCLLAALVLSSGVFRLARMHVSSAAAGLGAVLAVLANGELILQGMWYDLLSVGLALHFWRILQPIQRPWTGMRWLVSTLLFGLTIYAHPMGAIVASVVWAGTLSLVLAGYGPASKAHIATPLALIFPCAMLLSAPQIGGLLAGAQSGITIPMVDWRTGLLRVFDLGGLRPSDGRVATALVVVVLGGACVLSGRLRRLPAFFLVPLALLAGVSAFIMVQRPLMALAECCRVPFAGTLAYYAGRFSHLWGVLAVLVFVLVTGRRLGASHGVDQRGIGAKALRLGFLAPACILAGYLAVELVRSPMQLTLGTIREQPELLRVWSYLHDHAQSEEERVCIEPTFNGYQINGNGIWAGSTTRLTHVFSLTPLFAPGVPRVGGSMYVNRFNERYMGRSGTFLGVNPAKDTDASRSVAERMETLRCRYAISHSAQVLQLLSGVDGLQRVLTSGRLVIFRNTAMPPALAQRVRLIQEANAQIRVIVSDAGARQVVLPLAYTARWQARVGETELELDEYDRLLRLSLPYGWTGGELMLKFGSAQRRQISLLIAALGLGLTLSIALWFGWSRRNAG